MDITDIKDITFAENNSKKSSVQPCGYTQGEDERIMKDKCNHS